MKWWELEEVEPKPDPISVPPDAYGVDDLLVVCDGEHMPVRSTSIHLSSLDGLDRIEHVESRIDALENVIEMLIKERDNGVGT